MEEEVVVPCGGVKSKVFKENNGPRARVEEGEEEELVEEETTPGRHRRPRPCPSSLPPRRLCLWLRGQDKKSSWADQHVTCEDCPEAVLSSGTGKDGLAGVTGLEVRGLDSTLHGVHWLGSWLPNLVELRLGPDSSLASFRDLGTCLVSLRVLWAPRCGIADMDGITGLQGLEELYLAFNYIQDCTEIAALEHLQVLDLESNDVSESYQLQHLSRCDHLTSLTLSSNPLARHPSYRNMVFHAIRQLELLDDQPATAQDQQPPPEGPAGGGGGEWECHAGGPDEGKDQEDGGYQGVPGEDEDEDIMVCQIIKHFRPFSRGNGGKDAYLWKSLQMECPESNTDFSTSEDGDVTTPRTTATAEEECEMVKREEKGSSKLTHGAHVVLAGNPAKVLLRWRAVAGDAEDEQMVACQQKLRARWEKEKAIMMATTRHSTPSPRPSPPAAYT